MKRIGAIFFVLLFLNISLAWAYSSKMTFIGVSTDKEVVTADGQDGLKINLTTYGGANGSFPEGGKEVKITISGSGNILSPNQLTQTTPQTASCSWTLKSTAAETKTITVENLTAQKGQKTLEGTQITFSLVFQNPSISTDKSEIKLSKDTAVADGKDAIDIIITLKDASGKIRVDEQPKIYISGSKNTLSEVVLVDSSFKATLTSLMPEDKEVEINVDGTKLASLKASFLPPAPDLKAVKVGKKEILLEDIKKTKVTDRKIIALKGKALPLSLVTLYVYSNEPKNFTTQSDEKGDWLYTFKDPFSEGNHHIDATTTSNNKVSPKKELLSFEVVRAVPKEALEKELGKSSLWPQNPAFYVFLVLFLLTANTLAIILYRRLKYKKKLIKKF